MAERHPAQLFGRYDAGERLAVERKHLTQAGVEHQRLVAEDEELVESEACRRRDIRHEGRKAVNALGDFVDSALHGFSPCGVVDIRLISLYTCVY
jgi:hypothetical protein